MAFQFPWTNFHELNLDWFLSKFKQFANNFLATTATAESVPNGTPPSVTVTGGELDDDTDIVDPFTFNFKIPAGAQGEQGEQGIQGVPGQDGFSPVATVTKSGSVATITITDANGTTTATVSDGTVTQAQLDTKAPIIIASASGSVATFTDGAYNMPITDVVAEITPVQSGSGDPTPNNIRPISGWTGVNVYHDSAYDPTANPIVTLSWQTEAGTVYGGTVDVATGVLTVTHALYIITSSMLSGTNKESNLWRLNLTNQLYDADFNYQAGICNKYKFRTSYGYVNTNDNSMAFNATGGQQVIVRDDTFTSAQDVYDSLNATPIICVYPIVTPQTYQLTAQQLTTILSGTNAVWSDTGNTTVNYPADTKSYIEQLTQPAEDDMTANSTIANGKFFMVGNNLYRATTTIASGSQIIPGTNATALSLADALNLL